MNTIFHNFKYITVISIIVTMHFSCTNRINLNKISGEWLLDTDRKSKYIFRKDGTYDYKFKCYSIYENYGTPRYKFYSKNDTLWLDFKFKYPQIDGKIVTQRDKAAIQINGDYLTKVTFKKGAGINNHIDEYSTWIKDITSPRRILDCKNNMTFVIPTNFYGNLWIAFNQPSGEIVEYDSIGREILRIPESGKLLTQLPENAFAVANKCYNIISTDSLSMNYNQIPFIDKNEMIDSTFINNYERYAIVYGFNQYPRERINQIFGKSITGNVLKIYIGSNNISKK